MARIAVGNSLNEIKFLPPTAASSVFLHDFTRRDSDAMDSLEETIMTAAGSYYGDKEIF